MAISSRSPSIRIEHAENGLPSWQHGPMPSQSRSRISQQASDAHILRRILGLPPELTKPPAPKGVQRLHRVGTRLAPLGKWPLEAAFLSVLPGAQNVSTESLYNEDCRRVIPIR